MTTHSFLPSPSPGPCLEKKTASTPFFPLFVFHHSSLASSLNKSNIYANMEEGIEELVTLSEMITLFGERIGVNYAVPGTELNLAVHALGNASNALLPNPSCNLDEEKPQERKLLFAEHIWPGCLVMADYLKELSGEKGDWLKEKTVLELGAGAALPSLVASKLGAKIVVASDFPDDVILEHIVTLASRNQIKVASKDDSEKQDVTFVVQGHAWGTDCSTLLRHLPPSSDGFDIIILAECLWKDTYPLHRKLLQSATNCLSKRQNASVLVSFAHRPCDSHQPQHDLEFFQLAEKEFSMNVQLVKTVKKYADAMDNSELVEVFLYCLTAKQR